MGILLGCSDEACLVTQPRCSVCGTDALTVLGLQLAQGQLDRFTPFILATDSMEVKPIMTRKLRRRPNDPVPIPDKRRKPAPDIHLRQV